MSPYSPLPPISWRRTIGFILLNGVGLLLVKIFLGEYHAITQLIVFSFIFSGIVGGFIAASPIRGD